MREFDVARVEALRKSQRGVVLMPTGSRGQNTIQRVAELSLSARDRMRGTLVETPLREVSADLLQVGVEQAWVKMECCQVSGSFKARGATYYLSRLLEESSPSGVITYSSGNHGRALSEAAQRAGVAAAVVAPNTIDEVKAEAVENAGAELVRVGPTTDERKSRAEEIARERGWTVVPPFDHEWIMAGQGTIVLEVIDQLGFVPDHLWVPVGGGGLSGGCAAVAKIHAPNCQIHVVEPERSDALSRSFEEGRRARCESPASEADGLLPQSVGELNWEVLQEAGVVSHRISESQLLEALASLRGHLGVGSEPSGACAISPLLSQRTDPRASSREDLGEKDMAGTHVAIVSGGNVSGIRVQGLLGNRRGR